jgi:hypothetical protein
MSIVLHQNEGKSAASILHQVAALVPVMFCNFYIVKNHTIVNPDMFCNFYILTQQTLKVQKKISTYLESLEF